MSKPMVILDETFSAAANPKVIGVNKPMYTFDETFDAAAKLKVIGVGGGGGNAVNRMVSAGLSGVDFIAVNTDAMALDNSRAMTRVAIGKKLTGGLGAGANPDIGRAAMEEDRDRIKEILTGADMVFITAGMGGGTGTGGAPVVAEIAKELGILTVAIVTKPFIFEGWQRDKNSKKGIEDLRANVDTIIVVPNQKLLSIVDQKTSLIDSFKIADEVLHQGIKGISDVFTKSGLIQVDFADVRTVMKGMGDALMGTGYAEGEAGNRAVQAIESAIHSPLLDDISIVGARGLLINVTGGEDLSMYEVSEAMQFARTSVGEESKTNVIFGAVIDPEMKGKIKVTVIATGFSDDSIDKVKEDRNMSSVRVVLPPKVEQTALQLDPSPVAVAEPKSPADMVMAAQSNTSVATVMEVVAADRQATETHSLLNVGKSEASRGYGEKRPQQMHPDFSPRMTGLPFGCGTEDVDIPTFIRKQMN
jgi:cell division protein FtsZ